MLDLGLTDVYFKGASTECIMGLILESQEEKSVMPAVSKKILKEVRSLRQKKFRDEKQAYFAEGIAIVISALENKAPVRYVIYSPELLKSEAAYRALSSSRPHSLLRGRRPVVSVGFRAITLWELAQ